MTEITVFGVPMSPYVRSVLLGLEEKCVPYRFVPLSLADLRAPEHLGRNPFGLVPVIDHGGFHLYETQAILRYVDTLRSEPRLVPTHPHQAARMNQIIGIVDTFMFSKVSLAISRPRLLEAKRGLRPNEVAITAALPNARIAIAELDRLRARNLFMASNETSIADLVLAPQLKYFAETPEGATVLKGSPLLDWLQSMRARASMLATEPERLMVAA